MNCTDFLAKLTDYFDGQIDPVLLAEVKEHLGSCHHCEVVVNTTRQTIDVYRGHEPYEFPDELATRLRSAIMQRCRASCSPAAASSPAPEIATRRSE
ncbi:MAG TPA: zf-HC2 domain-containing protein [Acidobacteriaceae bacterium]|nr:zf-HC2 domain-containing protein [Acidobacteriaceae bacterium]